jgi:hypothetical protein
MPSQDSPPTTAGSFGLGMWTIVRSVAAALVILLATGAAWSLLITANLKYGPAFPWAACAMTVYLWLLWR